MYRTVETGAWDDPEVRPLSPQAKLLFFYLFTNRHTHVSGIYYLLPVTAAAETGLPLRVVDTLWDTLSKAELAWFDSKCLVVFVRSMLRHQGRGEKNERAAATQLGTLHNSFLISKFLSVYPSVARFLDDRVSDRVSKGDLPRAREEQEQEQKKEQEPSTPFPPPPTVAARAAKGVSAPPSIPPELDTPGFVDAWSNFLAERRRRRIKPYTDEGMRQQFERLKFWGPAVAVERIKLAIANGYQGIPEPQGNGHGGNGKQGTLRLTPAEQSLEREYLAQGMPSPFRRPEDGA